MAKDRYSVCGTICFCACVFVISGVTSAAYNNDYFSYSTDSDHQVDSLIHFEVGEQTLQNRHKRSTSNQSTEKSEYSTTEMTVHPTKVPETVLNEQKLLGVNGTGQRKNVTLVKQQPSLIHNISTSVNTPVKAISEEMGYPGVLPDILTPEDVGVGNGLDKDELAQNNITAIKTDTHIFYNSTVYQDIEIGKFYWVDMEKRNDVKISDFLSNSHRRATTIRLPFDFPFYGHYIKNVTVATGGFIYTGNYIHSWLAATQYIAPLMANFDTSLSNHSFVKHVSNGSAFTVEWQRVVVQDKPDIGEFTFQVTLLKNGDIVFIYKNVPLLIEKINDQHHPVKIGLSDAYILDRTVFFVRRKTIYEYHRVSFTKEDVKNWTTIYLKALPTCLNMNDCSSCVSSDINMNCTWCPILNQCSTGEDRNRQSWIDSGCELRNITFEPQCHIKEFIDHVNRSLNYDVEYPEGSFHRDYIISQQSQLGTSGYVAIIFLVAMVSGLAFWIIYAYRNPHTTSGQMLIRYRPSQWRWRRGEARYTAATIHM